MSDINQGLPVPSGQPSGIAPAPGQPPVATPTPATTTPAPTPVATPPAPDYTKIQKERDDAVAYARAQQSRADQNEARLRAMAGASLPVTDPLDAKVAAYSKQLDLHPDDARKFLTMFQAENAPLMQRNQQLEAQMQGGNLAQQAMQAAVNANPELFADPSISNAVWQSMQHTAQRGDLNALTPEYAKYLGAQEWAMKNEPWKISTQQAPVPQPMPGFRPAGLPPISFNGPPGQFPPPMQQQSNQPNPAVTALAAQMAAYTGIPLAQQ